MKTPMQQAEEYVLNMLKELKVDMGTYGLIELKFREMLEKEKDAIMAAHFAPRYSCFSENYYNERYNTKEERKCLILQCAKEGDAKQE